MPTRLMTAENKKWWTLAAVSFGLYFNDAVFAARAAIPAPAQSDTLPRMHQGKVERTIVP